MRTLTLLLFSLASVLSLSYLNAQEVIATDLLGQRTKFSLTTQFGAFIQNGVKLYKITYTTPDIHGQLDTASGLFIVPQREQLISYPTLVYHHGTVDGPQDVPSNLQGGYELALYFAGLGYATIAPDFLGAGEARGFHPYVHAASEASASADMLRAVRTYAPEMDVHLNDQLFITGYSQGGHASMALHRYLETEATQEFTVTAAAHMSGPYSISGVMLDLILSNESYGTVAYLPNIVLSFQEIYSIYNDLEDIFKPQYVEDIQAFRDGTIGLSTLNGMLIGQLVTEHGASITRHLLQDSIVSILEDPSSDHPLHLALRDNDVYQWAPQQPTRMYYCMADDQVNYRNAIVADSVMQMLNAIDVAILDVNSGADHGGCVTPATLNTTFFFAGFADWLVDTKDGLNELQINIFPNPTQQYIHIEGLSTTTQTSLFNINGEQLLFTQLDMDNNELSLQNIPNGIYFLTLKNTNGQLMRKVVLHR